MLESLVKSIENTFVQFSFRRLLYICFLLALVLLTFYAFDRITGYSTYIHIDHQITALERLHAMELQNIKQSKDLAPIFDSVLVELKQPQPELFSLHISYEPIIKFFAAALVPFIFVIAGMINLLRKQPGASGMFVGALFLTLIIGIPAILIPNWNSAWVNAGIYAILQFVVMIILILKYGQQINRK